MDLTNFFRVKEGTKEVLNITSIETWRVLNEDNEVDFKLSNDYLKYIIPESINDTWICADNERIKKTCGIGRIYDEDLNMCISEKPFDSWSFNLNSLEWEPPTPKPEGNYEVDPPYDYIWNEETLSWIKEF